MSVNVEIIDIGALANDGTGDPLRVAFDKINNNFANLAGLSFPSPGLPDGSFQYANGLNFAGAANLVFDSANNTVKLGSNISINTGSNVTFGSNTSPIHKIFVSNAGITLGNVSMTESSNTVTFSLTNNPGAKISLAGLNDINVSGNIITSGNVALGNSLAYGNTSIGSFKIDTPDNVINQVIYEFPVANMSSGTFKITSVKETPTRFSQYGVVDVLRPSDASAIKYVVHSTVFTGSPITTYNVDLHFGNVRIMVTPLFNSVITHIVSYETDK
jgi:hypothetical protein